MRRCMYVVKAGKYYLRVDGIPYWVTSALDATRYRTRGMAQDDIDNLMDFPHGTPEIVEV